MLKRTGLLILVLLTGALSLTACGGENDAPVKTRDTTGANKYNMPDKFDTVSSKCDGKGNRMFVTQNHGDSAASSVAVIRDPACGVVGP